MLRRRTGSPLARNTYGFTMHTPEHSPPRFFPLAVRVKEACRLTGIGRSKLYLLIKEGHVETIKVGSITLIPMRSLDTLVRSGAP